MENEKKKILLRRGSFRCASEMADACGALFAAGAVLTLLVLVLSLFTFGDTIDMLLDTMLVVCILLVVAVGFAWLVTGSDLGCEYEARETEFEVVGPKSKREIFYYNDVKSVSYSQIRKKDRLCGYVVTIVTGVRTVSYRYVFAPTAELRDTDATPFNYLEINCGMREETKLNINHEAVIMQLESRRRVQRRKKTTQNERVAEFLEGIEQSSKRSKDE